MGRGGGPPGEVKRMAWKGIAEVFRPCSACHKNCDFSILFSIYDR